MTNEELLQQGCDLQKVNETKMTNESLLQQAKDQVAKARMEQASELIDENYSYSIGCWLAQGWQVKCMAPTGINGGILVVFEREKAKTN